MLARRRFEGGLDAIGLRNYPPEGWVAIISLGERVQIVRFSCGDVNVGERYRNRWIGSCEMNTFSIPSPRIGICRISVHRLYVDPNPVDEFDRFRVPKSVVSSGTAEIVGIADVVVVAELFDDSSE